MHLSACQILLAISRIVYRVMDFYEIPIENKCKQAALVFLYIELSTYYLLIISITVDRGIACRYPLRYAILLSPRKMKTYLAASWMLGIIANLPSLFVPPSVTVYIFNYGTLPVLDGAFFITAVTGYGYLLYKMQKSKPTKLSRYRKHETYQRNRSGKFFMMAAIINLRFFILVIVPDVIFAIYFTQNFGSNNILRFVLIFCWYLNPIFDPITYIFMQQRIRSDLRQMFRCCNTFESKGQQESFTVSSTKPGNLEIYDTKL